MKSTFKCGKCGHIMFYIGHSFTGYAATAAMSMFPDNEPTLQSDPLGEEYTATCNKCGHDWAGDNLHGLKNRMIEDGVLK